MPDVIFIIVRGRFEESSRKPMVNGRTFQMALFPLSKYPQVSTQKDHPSKNNDCSKVIKIGNSFGISVKTKLC